MHGELSVSTNWKAYISNFLLLLWFSCCNLNVEPTSMWLKLRFLFHNYLRCVFHGIFLFIALFPIIYNFTIHYIYFLLCSYLPDHRFAASKLMSWRFPSIFLFIIYLLLSIWDDNLLFLMCAFSLPFLWLFLVLLIYFLIKVATKCYIDLKAVKAIYYCFIYN